MQNFRDQGWNLHLLQTPEAQSLNHWTTREVLKKKKKKKSFKDVKSESEAHPFANILMLVQAFSFASGGSIDFHSAWSRNHTRPYSQCIIHNLYGLFFKLEQFAQQFESGCFSG